MATTGDGGLTVTVTSDLPELRQAFRFLAEQELPFATAKALTATAQRARDEVREGLPRFFTLRTKWVERGLTINRAEKRDWPTPTAEVGHRDAFMALHVLGGEKTARSAPAVAIPQGDVHARRTAGGRVRASVRPGRLLDKARQAGSSNRRRSRRRLAFLVRSRKSGQELLVRRQGRGRYPLEILHAFRKRVRIDRSWPLEEQVQRAVAAAYGEEFRAALAGAIRSARARARRAPNR